MLAMRFDLDEVAKLPAGTTFYDRNGVEIAAPGGSGRKLVKREDIPDFLVKSLRAREDARFFEHHGVDLRGLARATVRNIKDRDFTQGASTLSMQLARNSFDMREKSLHRKFLEIALTLRIESRYTKDEILTHYLNRIYFGSGAYGIEQAARTYFGKTTRDLSDGECALIVGIIRGPHIFRLPQPRQSRHRTTQPDARPHGHHGPHRPNPPRRSSPPSPVKLVDEPNSAKPRRPTPCKPSAANSTACSTTSHIQTSGLHVHTTIDAAWQQRLETELNLAVEALESEKSWPHPIPGPRGRHRNPPTSNTPPSPPRPRPAPCSP
jgi:membrane peptidoglycan carboxypeptidase